MDGDEEDGSDEVIYPVDFKQAGHIVDDEIHHYIVKPLQQGVRLTAIFDSCHSGSVMDLPYIYSTKGILKEPNLAAEAGKGLLSAFLPPTLLVISPAWPPASSTSRRRRIRARMRTSGPFRRRLRPQTSSCGQVARTIRLRKWTGHTSKTPVRSSD